MKMNATMQNHLAMIIICFFDNKKSLCNFNYANIEFYVTKCRRFKTSPPFHAQHVDKKKAIAIEQLLLFRRLFTKQP